MTKKEWFFLFLWGVLVFRLVEGVVKREYPREGTRVVIRGCLSEPPQREKENESFFLEGIKIVTKGEYFLGDCLRVEGEVSSFLTRRGRKIFLINQPLIKKEDGRLKGNFFWWLNKGKKIQERLVSFYRRFLPEPEASLLGGVVLGAKSRLPASFYQELKRTGTLHVVVASGYNLTVVAHKPVENIAWVLGRRPALVVGWLLVWGYVFLVGFQPPVVRAALIISFVFLAQFWGRKFSVWRAFFLALWLMLVFSPRLIFNLSFQLSVAAMSGLLLFNEKMERLRKIPLVGSDLAQSLSAQLMVLPLIAHYFSQVSWASPMINMVVLPLIPWLMEGGFLALLGLVFSPLAGAVLFLTYPLAWLFVWLVKQASRLPGISLTIFFPWWLVVIYYLLIIFWLKKDRR